MAFQDLLNQPLPSKMDNDLFTEAQASSTEIVYDKVSELSDAYKTSTRNIKDKIKSIKAAIADNKFKAALNIINNCRKMVITDRKDIEKKVKYLNNTKGLLDPATVKRTMAYHGGRAATKLAIDAAVGSIVKKNVEDAKQNEMNAAKEYWDAHDREFNVNRAKKAASQEYHDRGVNYIKQKYEYSRKIDELNGRLKENEDSRQKAIEAETKRIKSSNVPEDAKKDILDRKIKAINNLYDLNTDKIQDRIKSTKDAQSKAEKQIRDSSRKLSKLEEDHINTLSRKSRANADLTSATRRYGEEKYIQNKQRLVAGTTSAAMAFTTGVTYATIKSFMVIKNNYQKYYDGVLSTLDDLENKCMQKSKNIKECLIDYLTLDQDMEMLMESAESAYDDFDDEDDIEEDIDISDMSDADLDELEDELTDSDIEDEMDDDDDEEVDLTPEEEREADDFMSLAATTELVRDELSATERAEFYSDPVQAQIAVVEGFMLESDFQDGDMVTEKFYNKTRVQFSKEDRKRQLFSVALNASARAHNDPDYIKLQKVQQMRRVLKARIRKKYRGEALRRVKVYMQRLKASKSGVLAKIGEKLHRDNKD